MAYTYIYVYYQSQAAAKTADTAIIKELEDLLAKANGQVEGFGVQG
jgi:hypothetical protein